MPMGWYKPIPIIFHDGLLIVASGGSTEVQGGAAAPPLAGKPWKKLKTAPLLVCPPCARHNASKMFSQFAAPTTHSAIGFAGSDLPDLGVLFANGASVSQPNPAKAKQTQQQQEGLVLFFFFSSKRPFGFIYPFKNCTSAEKFLDPPLKVAASLIFTLFPVLAVLSSAFMLLSLFIRNSNLSAFGYGTEFELCPTSICLLAILYCLFLDSSNLLPDRISFSNETLIWYFVIQNWHLQH
ncbi:hypothetical protein L3X38_014789 [Prunus dulcis]|uniref:Uncharacterized protein n=1 Tax=Prunus dulcis TaxID=3755 RepID=A0AAD4WNW3_PRUDU|nr:hypothetical protein L3X38_014789 [Prunus dulcis]